MATAGGVGSPGDPSDVTVVVPAYQAGRFLAEAIDSVLADAAWPAEVLVIDDGSTDGSAARARSYGGIVRVVSKPNGGEASARNAGLRAARTEWVAFLDADDRFLPGRLARLAEARRADPTVDALTTDGFVELAGEITGRCYGPAWPFPAADHRTEILRRNFVFGHVLARRERLLELGGFDESVSHCTDWGVWARLILGGGRVALVDEPLSIYRVHTGSLSADRVAMAQGSVDVLVGLRSTPGLSAAEREVLEKSIAAYRATVAREALTQALADGRAIRERADEVRRDPRQPARSRARAVAAALAPAPMAALHRRRFRGFRTGTMGRAVPVGPGDAGPRPAPSPDPTAGPDRPVPLVTVVLPFLDEERFLDRGVATVRAQTFPGWELLLVDDGSTDASAAIADRWAAQDPRIRVLRHPGGRNEGLPASRNLGLAHARAGAIAYTDADDLWEPDKLACQLRLLADHPDVGMVCGPVWTVTADGADRRLVPVTDAAPTVFGPGAFAHRLVGRPRRRLHPPPPSNVLYRTGALRAVGGIPPGDNLYEDQRTFAAVNLRYPVLVDDRPLSSYTVRPDSLYGSLAEDPGTKWRNEQAFHRWILKRGVREGAVGRRLVAALVAYRATAPVAHRLREAGYRWRAASAKPSETRSGTERA